VNKSCSPSPRRSDRPAQASTRADAVKLAPSLRKASPGRGGRGGGPAQAQGGGGADAAEADQAGAEARPQGLRYLSDSLSPRLAVDGLSPRSAAAASPVESSSRVTYTSSPWGSPGPGARPVEVDNRKSLVESVTHSPQSPSPERRTRVRPATAPSVRFAGLRRAEQDQCESSPNTRMPAVTPQPRRPKDAQQACHWLHSNAVGIIPDDYVYQDNQPPRPQPPPTQRRPHSARPDYRRIARSSRTPSPQPSSPVPKLALDLLMPEYALHEPENPNTIDGATAFARRPQTERGRVVKDWRKTNFDPRQSRPVSAVKTYRRQNNGVDLAMHATLQGRQLAALFRSGHYGYDPSVVSSMS